MRETNRPIEVLLGRACAACLHPVAAWRQFSVKWRLVTVTAYAAAGYVATFVALFALERV